MVRVGIAGIGFMGWIHYLSYQRTEGIELGAICTRDAAKLSGDWTTIKGNFGPPGEKVDVSQLNCYDNIDALLADDSIDVIDICLPPNLHAAVTCKAFAAGKHVFCEKPIALNQAECEEMMAAAKSAGKQLLIGHILPLLPEYAHALEVIRSGKYGKVIGGSFKRVISDPTWIDGFYDPAIVGGPLVDLHIHDAHFIRLLFGMPKAVTSQGRLRGDVVEYCNTMFEFDDTSLAVGATCGVINQQGRPFTHGFEIHLERATLQYELAVVGEAAETLIPLTIYDDKGEVIRPDLGDGDMERAFDREIAEVLSSVQSNQPSSVLAGELAADALRMCDAQTESVRERKSVAI